MERIAFDTPAASGAGGMDLSELDGVGAPSGGPQAAPETDDSAAAAGRAQRQADLDRTFDVIERIAQQGQRWGSAAQPARSDQSTTAPANGDRETAAKQVQSGRAATPSKAAGPDPTKLPTAAERQASLAAVAARGFTDVHWKPVPYMNQTDPPWGKDPYPQHPAVPGKVRTIGGAGCAPTALAMIDCGLRDSHVTPANTAKLAVKWEASGTPSSAGTNTAKLARKWADANGLHLTEGTSSRQSKNVDVLKAGLLANGVALVSVGAPATGKPHFSATSHVLVVNGCARRGGDDWFAVANPGRRDQARVADKDKDRLLATDEDVVQVPGAKNGVGQVWISRRQLEAEMKHCFVFQAGDVS